MPEGEAAVLTKRYGSARDATAEVAHRLGQIPQLIGRLCADVAADVELTQWRLPAAWRTQPAARSESRESISLAL
jgi:hypothetical protein